MKIKCLSCQQFEFDIDVTENDVAFSNKIISLNCPTCGKNTAILEREGGGGIQIALDRGIEKAQALEEKEQAPD